jgi:hypothetical protein
VTGAAAMAPGAVTRGGLFVTPARYRIFDFAAPGRPLYDMALMARKRVPPDTRPYDRRDWFTRHRDRNVEAVR